jgi:hypothetical protein
MSHILSFCAREWRAVILDRTAGFGNCPLKFLLIDKINAATSSKNRYTYSSMANLDIKGDSTVYVNFLLLSHATLTHKSDSVISNTVSQVSKPSATRTFRYSDSPNRSNSFAKSAMIERA